MRVAHLISNYKFTGPVDPALLVARGQREAGLEVSVFLGRPPSGQTGPAAQVALKQGLRVCQTPCLRKHRRFGVDFLSAGELRTLLDRFKPDVVHTHLGNDFRLAAKAGSKKIVHSFYCSALEEIPRWLVRLIVRRAYGVVAHSARLARALEKLGVHCLEIPPPLDLSRFDPGRPLEVEIPGYEGAVAAGIVARVQARRRFDLLLNAFKRAVEVVPQLRLVLVGRGTRLREVAADPVERMGLREVVRFTGYVTGDSYVALLRSFAFVVFLVPGTDGTCRALREALALGKPALSFRKGMIPEILQEGKCGLLVEETVEALRDGLIQLALDQKLRARLGECARERAAAFNYKEIAGEITRFYTGAGSAVFR